MLEVSDELASPEHGLVLRYVDRGDGYGGLETRVSSAGFTGHSMAWIDEDELLRFADELLVYPMVEGYVVELSGGYASDARHPAEEHVGLRVQARGTRGQVGVTVHLQSDLATGPPNRWTPSEVRVEVLTSYEALGRFSSELRHLVGGTSDDARLEADVFSQ